MAGLVSFDRVTKRFGDFTAVDGLSLDIHEREFFALLGPSGCGKTTLLRLLAGFEAPDAGHVTLAGQDLAGIPPYRRPVNMMFQSYALFPHMTVAANVAFGLAQVGKPAAIYERPASRWVAGFVGDVNLIEGRVTAVYPSFVMVEREGMRLRVAHAPVAPGPIVIALRPEKVRLSHKAPDGAFENGAAGTVTDIGYLGTLSLYKVRLDDGLVLKAAVMNELRPVRSISVNDRVW